MHHLFHFPNFSTVWQGALMRRVFFFCLLHWGSLVGAETLVPILEGSGPDTFAEVWEGFDPQAEPLDVEVLKEWEEDGVVMQVVRYRIGVFKGEKAMMAGIYGYPKNRGKVPGLVQIHGGGQYADYRAVLSNGRRGYATLSIAWAGRINAPDYRVTPKEVKLFWDDATDHTDYRVTTDWGALDGYHAPSRYRQHSFHRLDEPSAWTLDGVPSARNNGWFLVTLGARRALTFLEQQEEVDAERLGVYGHSMGGKLTVLTAGSDHRVKAAAPSCGGVSDRYNEDAAFRASVGDEPYLKRLSCPIVFLSPSNDFHGRVDDLQLAVAEIPSEDWRISSSPHHNHQDTGLYAVATQLWFDQHLKEKFTYPDTPETSLELEGPDGIPLLRVKPDSSRSIVSVDVYYTQDAVPTSERDVVVNRLWRHASPEKKRGGVWEAELFLHSEERPLWAYANVTYELDEPVSGAGYGYREYETNKFVVSSPLSMVAGERLQAADHEVTLKPGMVIESFEEDWEKEWFTLQPESWPRRTHLVNDPCHHAPEGSTLCLELRSEEANKLVVTIDSHVAEMELQGGGEWETIKLRPGDFQNIAGKRLTSWQGICELRLGGQETLRVKRKPGSRRFGAPWRGPDPDFRMLRWEVEKSVFRHPGISHSSDSIQFAKQKVASGAEPWATAWRRLTNTRYASLDWKPEPHPHVERGPYNNPNIGSSDFSNDARAAYTHALQWVISENEEHARKAAEILDAWSKTLQSISNHDARLLVGMEGYEFCNAAELIRHTWDGWPRENQIRFEGMLRDKFYPLIKDFYPTANGNWDAAMIQTLLAMGVFLEDRAMFERGRDYYLNGRGNGAVRNYFKPSGQCQESGRDQSHTQMGLDFLACSCEIAWNQGEDLYGAFDNRLLKGFEYTAKYNLGLEVPYEPYRSFQNRYHYREISDDGRGRLRPMYEKVYNHFHNRLGKEAEYTGEAARKLRGARDGRRSRRRPPSTGGTIMFAGHGKLNDLRKLMPEPGEQTSMWWQDGVPSKGDGRPWVRVVKGNGYAMAYHTETLAIQHFGALTDEANWRSLPPATLHLRMNHQGVDYHCVGAKDATRFTGPRVIESGRFLQRADVTHLLFRNEQGELIESEARLEIAAWPDRLSFILIPGPRFAGATLQGTLTCEGRKLQVECSGEQLALVLNPKGFSLIENVQEVEVEAGDRPVVFEPSIGWHRINLDGLEPADGGTNNAMESLQIEVRNPGPEPAVARLMFEKSKGGIRQKIGQPITGISAILRDTSGHPTGLPMQLSKNWHTRPEGGVHSGLWFHGITQVEMPPGSSVELELVIVYGHWGGLPAASHAQLSLIGWGGNQLWEQSALGAWGESICFDPEQAQAQCSITDVRPLMVTPMNGRERWGWTSNVGGGDFFRLHDEEGRRLPHQGMRAFHHRNGPCLTEVTYQGRIGEGIRHQETVSLSRTDDLVRGTLRIRMEVDEVVPFSRFAIVQLGAETYNFTREGSFAIGNRDGLQQAWQTTPGGDQRRAGPYEVQGKTPWASLHDARRPAHKEGTGAWANRGLIVRGWSARLGGEDAPVCFGERGVTRHRRDYSILEVVPPAGINRLVPGDYVEAVLEYLVIPQSAADYYGPSESLREALSLCRSSWEMVQREARGNRRDVSIEKGELLQRYPDLRLQATGGEAAMRVSGGVGYVAVTVCGLESHAGHQLLVDGEMLDQSVHGNDFWQTDYDAESGTWSRTYNIPMKATDSLQIELKPI
ncbi:MAG: alginate lyase family protein [Verrucomicrobiota bacterium JB023]|nr:alginate lyase family protein [Verrucomicrobiota bacterium JB023]